MVVGEEPEFVEMHVYGDDEMPEILDYGDDMTANNDFLKVGQLYPSKDELKAAVSKQALRDRFGYKVYKSTTQIYKVVCVVKECNWLMLATKVKDADYFQIRKYTYKHTCPFETRFQKHHKPSYLTVAEQIKTRCFVLSSVL